MTDSSSSRARLHWSVVAAVGVLLGVLLFAPPTAAAQVTTGTVSGRVVEALTSTPIAAVQLQIVGTTLGAQTNQQGEFTIRNVPAGRRRCARCAWASRRRARASPSRPARRSRPT